MTKRRVGGWISLALAAVLVIVPLSASAQESGIAGEVADDTGGVLPGVTVEVASPVLIEGIRTAFTDGEGRYNVTPLPPGTYTVTFGLPGFSTVIREGVDLTGGFTAAINVAMQVGGIEETITVTGASPVVDVQNVRQQTVVSDELLAALPSGTKGLMGMVRLIPGITTGAVEGGGGASGIYGANRIQSAVLHGKGGANQTYDGMNTLNLATTGNTTYIMNPSTVAETTVETGGISAESAASGLSVNMIPKEGGNRFSSTTDFTYANDKMQNNDNVTDALSARGLDKTVQLIRAYDVNFALGGPIKQDRVWFFTAVRNMSTKNESIGVFFNKTQGTHFYTPDLDRPAFSKDWLKSVATRVTWQINDRNKLNGFSDPQSYQTRGQGRLRAPESHTCWRMWPAGVHQATWTSTLSSRILIEAGVGLTKGLFPCTPENVTDIFDFVVKPTDIHHVEASTGLQYNAKSSYAARNDQDRFGQRFALSYVTGSHAFKTGFQVQEHVKDNSREINQSLDYRFNNGVPNRISQHATPYLLKSRTKADLGIFAQDQWAVDRLTLNLGVRFDYYNGYVPAQEVPATPFLPARSFDEVTGVPAWSDINPRLGASYDLFGNGRTAIKASFGRYVGKLGVALADDANPIATSVNRVRRSWSDDDGDFEPDCDLNNFDQNGECGAIDNANFGQGDPDAVTYADNLISGYGNRDYFWDLGAELQHELSPGVSLLFGYYRNWTDHFGSVDRGWNGDFGTGHPDNLAVTPEDFDPFCITAPLDPGLPGGGGYEVCGLYDVVPEKFGEGKVNVVRADDFDGKSRSSDFVTIGLNTRTANGMEIGAFVDTGRTINDTCFVVDSPQQLLNCRVVTPVANQTQVKVHASVPLPGDFLVSAVVENQSGVAVGANFNVRNNDIAPSLGRNLAACGTRTTCTSRITVPLVAPQTLFEDRRTNVDIRMSKNIQLNSNVRVRLNLDVYNAFNRGDILDINDQFGPNWRLPDGRAGGITAPRLFQVGGQLTF